MNEPRLELNDGVTEPCPICVSHKLARNGSVRTCENNPTHKFELEIRISQSDRLSNTVGLWYRLLNDTDKGRRSGEFIEGGHVPSVLCV